MLHWGSEFGLSFNSKEMVQRQAWNQRGSLSQVASPDSRGNWQTITFTYQMMVECKVYIRKLNEIKLNNQTLWYDLPFSLKMDWQHREKQFPCSDVLLRWGQCPPQCCALWYSSSKERHVVCSCLSCHLNLRLRLQGLNYYFSQNRFKTTSNTWTSVMVGSCRNSNDTFPVCPLSLERMLATLSEQQYNIRINESNFHKPLN